jgi:hypothetical protein
VGLRFNSSKAKVEIALIESVQKNKKELDKYTPKEQESIKRIAKKWGQKI